MTRVGGTKLSMREDDVLVNTIESSNTNNISSCIKMKKEVNKKTLKSYKEDWKSLPNEAYLKEICEAVDWVKNLIKKFDADLARDHNDYNKNFNLIQNKIIFQVKIID